MGPLSIKAQVQQAAGHVKNQMTVIKTLADEARKKDLHKVKLAKEMAKAKAEGLKLDQGSIGFSDGALAIPKPGSKQPDTTIKSNNKGTNQPTKTLGISQVSHTGVPPVTLENPEAGPSDTIPAMLTPGEAVIPASVAQDSAYKPVIEALVNEGRARNRQPGGVKGFADGTLGDQDVMQYESGGDPLARNPSSSATGLYQMLEGARKDVETKRPDLKKKDFNDPNVQEEYRGVYKDILSQQLKSKGVEPTEDNINKAWVVGAGGLSKVVSNPNAPLSETLGQKTVGINPNLQGKTGADFLADPNPYSRKRPVSTEAGSGTTPVPRPHRRGGTSGFLRDMAQGMPNQEYDNELAKLARQGTPEEQATAKAEQARLANARSGVVQQAEVGSPWEPIKYPKDTAQPQKTPDVPAVVPPVQKEVPIDLSTSDIGIGAPQYSRIDSALDDPNVKAELSKLQETPPPPGVEPKSWLADGLSKIFGKTGMFNEEDLIRFSLLAAGGMLTGGSVGGSLRFAGLATLKSSDERRGTEAAVAARQQAQASQQKYLMAKDLYDRNQKMEDEFHKYAAKADPAVKEQAIKMFAEASDPKLNPAMREAKLRAAITLLSANQVDEKKSGTVLSGYDSKTGKPYEYYFDKNNKKIGIDTKTGQQFDPAVRGINIIDDKTMNDIRRNQDQVIQDELAGNLERMNLDKSTKKPIIEKYNPERHARELTATFSRLREYLGYDADPKAMSKIVSNAIANIKEDYSGIKLLDLTPDALTKVVMGSAIIDSRQVNKRLYKATGNESGRLGPQATQMMTELFEQVKARGGNVDVALDDLERQYQELPKEIQSKFETAAKEQPGWSPFLLWMKAPKKTN